MHRLPLSALLCLAGLLAGCADTGGFRLSSSDQIAQPGQTIEVRTTLTRFGLSRHFPAPRLLAVRVYRDNELLAEHQPGGSSWSFVTPVTLDGIGEHAIDSLYKRNVESPPLQATCYAYCWDDSRVAIVVNLDGVVNVTTTQDWIFGDRVLGDPRPGSADTLAALAARFYICYVTTLPEESKPAIREWMHKHSVPAGPIFQWATAGRFTAGNQSAVLAGLRDRLPTLLVGIGQGQADMDAFQRNGMLAVMIGGRFTEGTQAAARFFDWPEAYQLFIEPANQAIFADPAKMLELHRQGGQYIEQYSDG